jgi:hypothetical protein
MQRWQWNIYCREGGEVEEGETIGVARLMASPISAKSAGLGLSAPFVTPPVAGVGSRNSWAQATYSL